jgi:hypothetical protein
VAIPVTIALAPGLLSERHAHEVTTRVSANDTIKPAGSKPRSIEFVGDARSGLYASGQRIGDEKASCNEICRRLLFNGEADLVRMTRLPELQGERRPGRTFSITYHREHRDICPELFPSGTQIEPGVRDRLVMGDCLIWDTNTDSLPDAVVKFTTNYFDQHTNPYVPPDAPDYSGVESVKELQIESRQGAVLSAILRQTETVANVVARPFYIGAEFHLGGGYNGATIGRHRNVTKPIDLVRSLQETLGYEVADFAAVPLPDERETAESILSLPMEQASSFSAQQQDVLGDVSKVISTQSTFSDPDLEFIGKVIADKRVTETKASLAIAQMVRRRPDQFKRLLPVLLDRMAVPAPNSAHFRSLLGWSLMNYSAEDLQPYRNKMIDIVRDQTNWTINGLLVRLAELDGDDAVNLVIGLMDSKQVSEFAAIAACRSKTEGWPALEPAVLAHLAQESRFRDDDQPLLLAMVRFGEKPQAIEAIKKRGLANETHLIERLSRFEPGFDPKHCRDRL